MSAWGSSQGVKDHLLTIPCPLNPAPMNCPFFPGIAPTNGTESGVWGKARVDASGVVSLGKSSNRGSIELTIPMIPPHPYSNPFPSSPAVYPDPSSTRESCSIAFSATSFDQLLSSTELVIAFLTPAGISGLIDEAARRCEEKSVRGIETRRGRRSKRERTILETFPRRWSDPDVGC